MTVAPPIREPSVDIFQTTAPTPTPAPAAGLPPCCVAPNYQWVRAQSSAGDFSAEAEMGTYQDLDATITYALPGLEDGAVFDDDSLRCWLVLGSDSQELDGPDSETVVIDSTCASVVVNGSNWDLTDTSQDFTSSGVLGGQEISGADYVVRMADAFGTLHDFPVVTVATNVLTISESPDGPSSPDTGAPPTNADYQVVLNPAKFQVNSAAIAATLRADTAQAAVTIPGTTPGSVGDVVYTAVDGGNEGNSITVAHVDTGSLSVVVAGLAITVNIDAGTTTAADVISAITASAPASALVTASLGFAGTVAAAVATNLTGGGHLLFTADTAGAAGNSYRVRYVDPGTNNASLTLTLSGYDLTISMATDGGGTITTTDADIETAVNDTGSPVYGILTAVDFPNSSAIIPDPSTTLAAFTNLSGGWDANSVTLDANLLGNTSVLGTVYVEYRALRLKYTAAASTATTGNEPMMVSASSVEELEAAVGELTDDNPLGLMMYLTMQNFPNGTVYGLGVDAVSTSETDGTTVAWSRAADFLTGQNPYYLAIGSQRDAIHAIWKAHIEYMNGDDTTTPAVLERYLFINKEIPLYTPDTLLGNGDTVAARTATTVVVSENLTLLGVTAGDVLVLDGYVTGADTTLQDGTEGFEIASLGDDYTMNFVTAPDPGGGTYPDTIDWYIYSQGVAIDPLTDKLTLANTINELNQQIAHRKISSTFPDNATIAVEGTSKNLPGYYRDAAQIGQCAAQPVSMSKYNQPLVGIDEIRYSNDYFSNAQLDIIQGGGTWVYHVPTPGGSVVTRRPLSTDTTDILTREPTNAWQVDKFSRLVRITVRKTLGNNITAALLDDIASRINNVARFMYDAQELADASIDSLQQGDGTTHDYDTIVVRGTAVPLFPNNGVNFYITIAAA